MCDSVEKESLNKCVTKKTNLRLLVNFYSVANNYKVF